MPVANVTVVLTDEAARVLERVRGELGDELTMLIGNGCCDSTAPFLFSRYAPGPAETPSARSPGCRCTWMRRWWICSPAARW